MTGKLNKLGLGYEEVSKIHPTIIYCSISGMHVRVTYDYPLICDNVMVSWCRGVMVNIACRITQHATRNNPCAIPRLWRHRSEGYWYHPNYPHYSLCFALRGDSDYIVLWHGMT